MVDISYVEEQLRRIGCNFRFWGRGEIKELANVLWPEETIAGCVNGRYEGGFAMLCATNFRVLLVDKKPMFLTVEDVRFDMIAEIDYGSWLLGGVISILTPNRRLVFKAWNNQRLRVIADHTQQRVMETRQPHMSRQFEPQVAAPNRRTHAPRVGGMAMRGSAGHFRRPGAHGVPILLRRGTLPRLY